MDMNQEVLVNLLSSAIRDRKPEGLENKIIDWKGVYEQARLHAVHPLILPILSKLENKQAPDSEILSTWQNSALVSGLNQVQHIFQASKVLEALNNADIPVIILKGLVLRDLYPHPELRTMSDADILIHKEHMDSARKLLLRMGYEEEDSSSKHIAFTHKEYFSIEVHWTLVDSNKFEKVAWFDKSAWDNAEPYTINDLPTLSLSKEDELLHVCLHMAGHLMSCGFGVRQLCDLVLLIEDKKRPINWSVLNEKIAACGLESFFSTLLMACKKLFNLELPKDVKVNSFEESPSKDELILDILEGGVYGNSNMSRTSGSLLLHYTRGEKRSSTLKVYLSLLFPASQKLANKYSYARKHHWLLPIAWLHRLIYIVIRKDYTLSDKKVFLSANEVLPVLERRAILLEQLGLQ